MYISNILGLTKKVLFTQDSSVDHWHSQCVRIVTPIPQKSQGKGTNKQKLRLLDRIRPVGQFGENPQNGLSINYNQKRKTIRLHWSLKAKGCFPKSLNGRLHAKERS